jgi:hypothetical protein
MNPEIIPYGVHKIYDFINYWNCIKEHAFSGLEVSLEDVQIK